MLRTFNAEAGQFRDESARLDTERAVRTESGDR